MKYKKVIIWGHPLHSHTHSYVHEAYYKAFKFLGYETYWFHDKDFPSDFDYSNSLFITEGYADNNIPILDSSCYIVMYCPSPIKYQSAGRYIDIRMAAVNFKDHIQNYSLDKSTATKVGPACYFEKSTNEDVIINNNYVNYSMKDFDKLYISWASNLLPNEFDFDSVNHPRKNIINYCGTISASGECENYSQFGPFINECQKNGIPFNHNDPWRNPLSSQDVIKLVRDSVIGIDLRGPKHLEQRLITCRVFKNISYGHVGVTNSLEIHEEMNGLTVYHPDPATLLYNALSKSNHKKLALESMRFVQANHTYINRINSILSIL